MHICDLNSLNNYIFNNDISLEKFSIDFIKQIDYVRKLFDDVIVFIAPENYFIDDNHNENVYLINHIKRVRLQHCIFYCQSIICEEYN